MLSMLTHLLGVILTLLLVIGFHEAGHFFIAKRLGVKVLRFSIGFGKTLWHFRDKKGTEYVIAAIPLGGYVKMLDESEDANIPRDDLPLTYNRQPFYKRFLIVAAGPMANLILAFVLYWLLFMVGFTTIKPIVGQITPHSIAATVGMTENQEIVQIDHHDTRSWMGVVIRLLSHAGDSAPLSIQTNTSHYALDTSSWKLDDLNPDPLASLGIVPLMPKALDSRILRNNQYGPIEAATRAWQNTALFTQLNFIFIGKMFSGKLSLKSLSGPITIFQTAGIALHQGMVAFVSFVAFLSISIGVINLLPIPGLDGGHLFMQTLELIIRRPLSPRIQTLFYRLGIVLILLLVTQAVTNDIIRLSH